MRKQITIIKKDLQELFFEINVKEVGDSKMYSVSASGKNFSLEFGSFKYGELEGAVADVENWIYSNYSDGDHVALLKDLGFHPDGVRLPGSELTREQSDSQDNDMDKKYNTGYVSDVRGDRRSIIRDHIIKIDEIDKDKFEGIKLMFEANRIINEMEALLFPEN